MVKITDFYYIYYNIFSMISFLYFWASRFENLKLFMIKYYDMNFTNDRLMVSKSCVISTDL